MPNVSSLVAGSTGLLVALALGEALVRTFLPAPLPWRYPQVRFRTDEASGFALAPNQHSYTADKPVRTNSLGLRGPAVAVAALRGASRILFLGDSVTFGFGVSEQDTVTSRLQSELRDGGLKAEVINAAVPAYNTVQELALLETRGLSFHPDWVLLGFYWNDLNDKSGVLVTRDGDLVSNSVDLERSKTMKVRLGESPAAYAVRNALKRMRLLYAVTTQARGLLHTTVEPDDHRQFRTEVLSGADTPRTREGWDRVERALERFRRIADERGFRPLVVVWPAPMSLARDFGAQGFPAGLEQRASVHGLPILDLHPVFRKHYSGHDSLFIPYDADHPNSAGHRLAASAVAAFLLRESKQPGS